MSFIGFSQIFLWCFAFFRGLKFFPAPSSRKVVLPLIGGERELCVALNAGGFQDFRHFSRNLAAPRSRKVAFGKSRSRKVARRKRPPGKYRARRVGFSRKFAALSSQKVVFPESRVRGKSLNEAPWIATLLRGFERGPASPESRKSTSRVLPESRVPGKSLNEPPETCLMKSSTSTVFPGFLMGYFLSFS